VEGLIMQQGNTPSNALQASENAYTAMPEYVLNDLPKLQSKHVKANGKSRQNLLDAMAGISGSRKITIKPDAPPKLSGGIIAGSDASLAEPVFDSLEI